MKIGRQPIVNERGRILLIRLKADNAPRGVDPPKKAGRGAWLQIHVKAIKRNLKSATACFDVGLFAGPAKEEALDSVLRREAGERSYFSRGKVVVRDIFVPDTGTNSLDVHPDVSIPAEGKTATSSE